MASVSPLGEAATASRASVTVELDEEDFGLDILPAEEPPDDRLLRGFSHATQGRWLPRGDEESNTNDHHDMGNGEEQSPMESSAREGIGQDTSSPPTFNSMGTGAYIQRFRRGTNGRMLAAEKTNALRPGMRLCTINDTSVEYAPFERIVYLLHNCTRPVRLKFKDESTMDYKDSYQFPCTKAHHYGEKKFIDNARAKWGKRDVLWLEFLKSFGVRQVQSGEIRKCGIHHKRSELKDAGRLAQYGIMGISRHPDGFIRYTASVPEEAFQGSGHFVSSSEFSARRCSAFHVLSKPSETESAGNGHGSRYGIAERDRPSREARNSFANSLPSSSATIAHNQHHQQHFQPGKVQSLPDLETTRRATSLVESTNPEGDTVAEQDSGRESTGQEKGESADKPLDNGQLNGSQFVADLISAASQEEYGAIHAYKRIWDVHSIGSPDFDAILREHIGHAQSNSSSEFLAKKITQYGGKPRANSEGGKDRKTSGERMSSFLSRIFEKKHKGLFDKQCAADFSHAYENLRISVSGIRELHGEFKSLVHEGLPAAFRGQIWFALSGAQSKAQLYPSNYFHNIVKLGTSYYVYDCILKDVHRTFPGHPYFETLQVWKKLAKY
eukprot:gb/GECG01001928.1/.p1 GENE.gb/GECG01001928.1/~~gb/GECG01001928.1/.p1  ORF type:complete len:611 (+),score=75.59 gb/GECG01001928.1/:1-1833(+)